MCTSGPKGEPGHPGPPEIDNVRIPRAVNKLESQLALSWAWVGCFREVNTDIKPPPLPHKITIIEHEG